MYVDICEVFHSPWEYCQGVLFRTSEGYCTEYIVWWNIVLVPHIINTIKRGHNTIKRGHVPLLLAHPISEERGVTLLMPEFTVVTQHLN